MRQTEVKKKPMGQTGTQTLETKMKKKESWHLKAKQRKTEPAQ